MSGIRLTTGIGIAVGGIGGALAALMGGPAAPAEAPAPTAARAATARAAVTALATLNAGTSAPSASVVAATVSAAPPPLANAAVAPVPSSAAATREHPSPSTVGVALSPTPALELPTTREALLRAEMLCDQKQDPDQCARAAAALDQGTAGPADAEQAKRFRKIALTHLVTQCEGGVPHACFVLAAKYRAGVELPSKPNSADALEKRGVELCRMRSAPECPAQ